MNRFCIRNLKQWSLPSRILIICETNINCFWCGFCFWLQPLPQVLNKPYSWTMKNSNENEGKDADVDTKGGKKKIYEERKPIFSHLKNLFCILTQNYQLRQGMVFLHFLSRHTDRIISMILLSQTMLFLRKKECILKRLQSRELTH